MANEIFYPITLNSRQICDLELLLDGSFYPLNGFLNECDYISVVENMRLASGELWPIPIVLPIDQAQKDEIDKKKISKIQLRDTTNLPLAFLHIKSIYKPNLENECKKIFSSNDDNHPYIKIIMKNPNVYYVGGKIESIQQIPHYDYKDFRLTPYQSKKFFYENGWDTIIGFQTRNPMHRSHYELTKFALKEAGKSGSNAKLFLQPVIGVTQECDVEYHTRVRCYKKLIKYYDPNTVKLAFIPLSMRMAGPREALWHALIRKNYGCTHFVVGRDHAGPSYKKKTGENFFQPYAAQELLISYAQEINLKIIKSPEIVYVKELDGYIPETEIKENMTVLRISGTEQRNMLTGNKPIPSWYSFPDVMEELRKEYQSRGLCIYFIGLSCSGKSTMANALKVKLEEENEFNKKFTLLDGDVVRQFLSKGLKFTKEDRSANVRRIGYVASEVVKHGGVVLCANIAPYNQDRLDNRELISGHGNYIEVYIETDVIECEKRDVKGLYKLARQGIIKDFTGVNDPFEQPTNADIVLKGGTVEENLDIIIKYLKDKEIYFKNLNN